jgi:hypothetical protein
MIRDRLSRSATSKCTFLSPGRTVDQAVAKILAHHRATPYQAWAAGASVSAATVATAANTLDISRISVLMARSPRRSARRVSQVIPVGHLIGEPSPDQL